jgi:2-polyprenyl-3-methyl-5-hydroxy-6-metoxy-1,4-benzoquinol methylase
MTIQRDPENNETRELSRLYPDFSGRSVLEIGCGEGRLTWRYAAGTARVIAIDPDSDKLARAVQNRPDDFGQVEFLNLGLEPYAAQAKEKFDLAILAWSL